MSCWPSFFAVSKWLYGFRILISSESVGSSTMMLWGVHIVYVLDWLWGLLALLRSF